MTKRVALKSTAELFQETIVEKILEEACEVKKLKRALTRDRKDIAKLLDLSYFYLVEMEAKRPLHPDTPPFIARQRRILDQVASYHDILRDDCPICGDEAIELCKDAVRIGRVICCSQEHADTYLAEDENE